MRHWIKPLATLFALPLATLLAVMLFPAFFLIPSRDGTETHAVVRETLRWLSLALLTAGATHLVLGKALSLYARRSRDTLVKAFRAAWSLTVFNTFLFLVGQSLLVILVALAALIQTGSHELGRVIVFVAAGLGIALFQIVRSFRADAPIETRESAAKAVTPTEAPRLWDAVRSVAFRLNTAPPDHIVLGLTMNCYVTQHPIVHSAGRTEGRSLYLSLFLLQSMTEEQVLAIVGHELGHFKGEDTTLTLEFYPRYHRHALTIDRLAKRGWLAKPAFFVLATFFYFFRTVETEYARSRELAADLQGAAATNTLAVAKSLVRSHVGGVAFTFACRRLSKEKNDLSALFKETEADILGDPGLWKFLETSSTPHPYDTHPPLRARLENLGQGAAPLASLHEPATLETSAYTKWIGVRDAGLDKIREEFSSMAKNEIRAREAYAADAATKQGEAALAELFPAQRWQARPFMLWGATIVMLPLQVLFAALPWMAPKPWPHAWLYGGGIFLFGCLVNGLHFYWAKGMNLELTHDGVRLSTWRRKILFSEIKEINAQSQYTFLQVFLHFFARQPAYSKISLFPWKKGSASLQLGYFGGQQKIYDEILRYYVRHWRAKGSQPASPSA